MIAAGLYSTGRSAIPSLVVQPLVNDLAPTNLATKGFSYQIFWILVWNCFLQDKQLSNAPQMQESCALHILGTIIQGSFTISNTPFGNQ